MGFSRSFKKLVQVISIKLLIVWPINQYAQSLPANVIAGTPWPRHTIDASSEGADGVKLTDINRDGRLDLVTGWEEGNITKLYLHPGSKNVKQPWPAVVVGNTPAVEDAVFADMNADGRADVVSCTEKGSEKIFIHWSPKRKHLNASRWKQDILPASDGLMMWMYAEPCQLDGQFGIDLLAAGKGEGAALGWFEAPADASDLDGWRWHSISPVGWVMSLIVRDMDMDGDEDVVITDRYGPMAACRWLENPGPGPQQKQPWASHMIGAVGLEVMFMTMADLDGDGREEAIVSERSGNTIQLFSRSSEEAADWQIRIINLPPTTGKAKSVEVGDVNGDGHADLIISTNTYGEEVNGLIWMDGHTLSQPNFKAIASPHNAKYDKVVLMDVDEDGDLDVLICEENFGEDSEGLGLIWYENQLQE